EAVALYDNAGGDGQRCDEHRPGVGERVKLSTLAAGVDIRGKFAQECAIKFASGEGSRQCSRIDACDARAQAAVNHLSCELARIAAPERKDWRQPCRGQLLL